MLGRIALGFGVTVVVLLVAATLTVDLDIPQEFARLDRRTDVLSFSVWGEDFEEDLQQFEPMVPERKEAGERRGHLGQLGNSPKARTLDRDHYDLNAIERGKATLPWQVLVFHQEQCGPCRRLIAETLVPMSKSNWTTGQYGEPSHFQLIECAQHEDLVDRFRVHQVPTLVIMKHGKEVARRTGFVDDKNLSHWVNSYVAPKQVVPTYSGGWFRRR